MKMKEKISIIERIEFELMNSTDISAVRLGEVLLSGFSILKNEKEIVALLCRRKYKTCLTKDLKYYRKYLESIGYRRL